MRPARPTDSAPSGLSRSRTSSAHSFAEHFCFKLPHIGIVPPRVKRQTGLPARFGEKCLAIPAPLGGHLRQQQAPMPAPLDDQTVTAEFQLFVTTQRFEGAKQRQFNGVLRE